MTTSSMPSAPEHPTVIYLFDPLCGWCYGASPMIQRLASESSINLELLPTGLFAGTGARALDSAFADYAWANDKRIEKLTGQLFTQEYLDNVLRKPDARFDSSAATLALTAVSLIAPDSEVAMLKVIQEARYVRALDTCDTAVVAQLMRDMQLGDAADRLAKGDDELLHANATRLRKAQSSMQMFRAQGVPSLVVTNSRGSRLLRGDSLHGSFESLLEQIGSH